MVARGDLGVEIGAAERAAPPEADHPRRARARQAGDHRDADARVDDPLAGADAGRGARRRERDPRRHVGAHALRRDGGRRVPGRGGAGDGPDRAAPSSRASATATRSRRPTTSRRSARRCRTPPATSPRRSRASAILVPTFSGRTASAVARLRPRRPIVALTHNPTRCSRWRSSGASRRSRSPEATDVEELWARVDRGRARRRHRRRRATASSSPPAPR